MSLTVSLVLDVVLLAVLVYCAVLGARRGFVLTLCSLLAVLLALVGGWYLAANWSDPLEEKLEPVIYAKLAPQETEQGEIVLSPDDDLSLSQRFSQAVQKQLTKTVTDLRQATAHQWSAAVAGMGAKSAMFLIGFLAVLVVWLLLCRALDLVAKLPGLRAVNKGFGALIGLIKGLLILIVVRWALCDLLGWIPPAVADASRVLPLLTNLSVFSLFGG